MPSRFVDVPLGASLTSVGRFSVLFCSVLHAIGAPRQIIAFPLLGLVGKEKVVHFAGVLRT